MSTDLATKTVEAAYNVYYKNVPESVIYRNEHFSAVFAEAVRRLLRDCYYDPPKGSSVGEAAQVVVDNKMAGMVFNDIVVKRCNDEDGPGNLETYYNIAVELRSRDQLSLPAIQPLQLVTTISKDEVRQALKDAGADLKDGSPIKEPPEVRPGVVVRLKSGGPKMAVLQLPDGNGVCECGWFECLGAYGPGLSIYGTYRKDFFLAASLNIVTEETA